MSPENGHGPIQEATAGLVSWLASATDAAVRTAPPDDTDDDVDHPVLSVLVLALAREQELRSADRREPLRFRVRHLVTGPVASDVTARLLDRVLAAAVETGEPMVVLEPPPPELWLALRATPRAALLVDVPTQVARPAPVVPLVRSPLQVRSGPVRSIRGRIVGPADMPLTGIRVEVAGTGAATYTDTSGRFTLAAVPDEESLLMRLSGKGREFLADVVTSSVDDIVIHCDLDLEEA